MEDITRKNVNLAKALKLKNRRAQNVQNLQNKIRQYNSYLEGAKREFEVVELYAELKRETAYLVETKSAINAANASIQGKIYEMAEYKGLAAFLKTVSTQSGRQVVSYGMAEPQVYVAQLSATDIDKEVRKIEQAIQKLQDELDDFNAEIRVEVPVDAEND